MVLAYRQITNLRVRLISMFQLQLPPNPMYQYFAVSEWVVEGTCMCNGHASMCAPAPGESIAQDKVRIITSYWYHYVEEQISDL